jgi:tRNA (adenine22-N1)-methyltransferase
MYLLSNGKCSSAIVTDLNEKPLERAKETGRTYGAEGIDYRLANGLADIRPEETDVIAIAGMGGETIAAILEAAPWTADGQHTLLLQPMTKDHELRRYLMEHGYCIRREALVYDRGTIYPVMEVVAGEMELSLGQIYGGARLMHDPLGDRYLIEKIIRLFGVIAGINRSADRQEEADRVRDTVTALLEMREEWRNANGT